MLTRFCIHKDWDWNLFAVYLGSSSLKFTKGAVFLQHRDAAIRVGTTERADAGTNRETPGGSVSEA
jgi:hypothetical protein